MIDGKNIIKIDTEEAEEKLNHLVLLTEKIKGNMEELELLFKAVSASKKDSQKEPVIVITAAALEQVVDIFDRQLKTKNSNGHIILLEETVMEMKVILKDAIKIINSKKGE